MLFGFHKSQYQKISENFGMDITEFQILEVQQILV